VGQPVFLIVGGERKLLGQAFEPGDVPELLRHVADYYDDNPDDCATLFFGRVGATTFATPATVLDYLTDPFGGDYAGL
jgi:hypothetical protein